jgi:hypothetical protein
VPGQVVVVEGVKYAPMTLRMYENSEKTGSFSHFLAYKSLKMPFFAQKYFIRYTPRTFCEEYIILRFFAT